MASLILRTNNSLNPLTLDLSGYMDVSNAAMDLSNPAFTNRVWSRSLLKEGATLALESLQEKELVFPLNLGPVGGLAGAPNNLSQTLQFVQQINMILETPGATLTWQPDGASQSTFFDILSGQCEIAYNFRKEGQSWESATLRVFTQPLGRTAGRALAQASGMGPVLMITPYASTGSLSIGASTQAGVAGWGGKPYGASTGVFYSGNPSLAGDAPALLQLSWSNSLLQSQTASFTAVSLLPDQKYKPMINMSLFNTGYAASTIGGFVALLPQPGSNNQMEFNPLFAQQPTPRWDGNHRLFVLARASGTPGTLTSTTNLISPGYGFVQTPVTASIAVSSTFQLYDMGTMQLRGSQTPAGTLVLRAAQPSVAGVGSNCAIDATAVIMLPDSTTWFYSSASALNAQAFVIDDVWSHEQFLWIGGASTAPALSNVPGSAFLQRLTPFSRGLPPKPDPKDSIPVLAVMAWGSQPMFPTSLMTANVSTVERTRFVLP